MAQELPEYKASVQVNPAPVANAGEPFQRLSSALETFSMKRAAQQQQVANMQAAQAGEEAGYNLNYQPASGGSETDMVYNRAARRANRLAVGADVGANISRIQSQILNNPNFNPATAMGEFSHAVEGYSQGLMANIPKSSQPYAQNLLKYHVASAANAIDNHVAGATKAGLFVDGYQINEQFVNEATNAAFKGDANAAGVMFGQFTQNVKNNVVAGIYSPGYAAQLIHNGHTQLIYNTYLGQAQRAIDGGQIDKFYEGFQKHDFTKDGLNEQEWQSLNARVFGMVSTARRNKEMTGVSINEGIKDNVARASQGYATDPNVDRDMLLYPEKMPEYKAAMDAAKTINSATKGLHDVSIDKRQDIMNSFAPDPNKSGFAHGLVAYNQIQKISEQQQHLMMDDPAAYTQQSPLYKSIVEKYQQTKDFDAYNNDILAYQTSMGIPQDKQSIMPHQQASGLVGKIRSADYDNGLTMLTQLQASYGKNSQMMMKSLTKNGLPKTYNMLIGMQNIPKSAPAVPDAIQAFNLAEGKVPGGKGNELETIFKNSGKDGKALSAEVAKQVSPWINSTSNYSSMSGAAQAEYIAGVTNLAKFYAAKGDSVKDAATKAYSALIGNKYEVIDDTYRVPKGIAPNLVKASMMEKDRELSSFNFQELRSANPYLSKQYLSDRQYSDAVLKGHWVSLPDDTGYARVDVNGLPVKDKSGNLFKLTNQDLITPKYTAALNHTGGYEWANRYEGLLSKARRDKK